MGMAHKRMAGFELARLIVMRPGRAAFKVGMP